MVINLLSLAIYISLFRLTMSSSSSSSGAGAGTVLYDNGRLGLEIKDDGSGFIYYSNGKQAITISTISSYQKTFHAFDYDNKGTILMAIDEYANGFASTTSRKNADINNNIMIVLNNKGGIISEDMKITKEWSWNKDNNKRHDTLIIQLNENLTYTYKDKKTMSLEFQCENIKYTIGI